MTPGGFTSRSAPEAGVDPMSGAPSEVSPEQLEELGLRLAPEEES